MAPRFMMQPWLVALLTASLATHRLAAQSLATAPAPDSAALAGWYDLGNGSRVLVTWGPRGGYRLLDFDSLHFHRLEKIGPRQYRMAGSGAWEGGVVSFGLGAAPAAATLTLTWSDQGPAVRGARAAEYPFDLEEVQYRNGTVSLAGVLLVPRVKKLVGKAGDPDSFTWLLTRVGSP